jgi:hypothetical protein
MDRADMDESTRDLQSGNVMGLAPMTSILRHLPIATRFQQTETWDVSATKGPMAFWRSFRMTTFVGPFRIKPAYLLVTERALSYISFKEMEEIGKNIDKITKQRDDIVSQIYRSMLFLASLLILIFLIEINLVTIPSTVWGVQLTTDKVNNQDMFIFGFLLIGNIIALLFSSAMVKMFMLEYILKTYCTLSADGVGRYVSGMTTRFYVFVFGLVAEQNAIGVPAVILKTCRLIHWITVVILPVMFIVLYCSVFIRALLKFWTELPSGTYIFGQTVELWYFILLLFFNALTLSFYAFAFFPCPVSTPSPERLEKLTEARASELWEKAERPKGKLVEIEILAERQMKLRYGIDP